MLRSRENPSRLRVLFFFHETTWSGAPIQLCHLVKALDSGRYDVAAAVPISASPESGPISDQLRQIGIEIFPLIDLSTSPNLEELRSLCRQFDVVVANTLVMWAAVKAAHAEGVPVIWYIHESRVAEQLLAQNPEMKPALALADLLVMPTRRTAQMYAAYTERSIDVVPYGIPAVTAPPLGPRADRTLRQFLLVGSYEQRKGQDVFLDAIARIPERTREKAFFRTAGRKLDEGFYDTLATRAANLPNVVLGDALEHGDAVAAIGKADALVCASRDETMPIAILEAMSLGRAIVSTGVGGITEWLTDGFNALIVPAENSAALAQAIIRCIDEGTLVATLGAEARRTFSQNFSIAQLGRSFALLLERLHKNKSR